MDHCRDPGAIGGYYQVEAKNPDGSHRHRGAHPRAKYGRSRYGRSGRSRRRRSVAAQSMSVGPIDRVVDESFAERRVVFLATLIRLLGDFDLAEEARRRRSRRH